MPGEIKSIFIPGPAGKLEALLNSGAPDAAYSALVCHPHPLHGGTMHNKVVFHIMKALSSLGLPVLRFNFRGAGRSEGEHDAGRGEVEDARAALDWLGSEYRVPIIFAGFSFGAVTGLRAACPDQRVAAAIAVGLPLDVQGRAYEYAYLHACPKPKLFISGSRDEYGPAPALRSLIESLPAPVSFVLLEGGDHFLQGQLDRMRAAIESWARSSLPSL